MLNRHKALLALIAAFGGEISKTDCHKLMFLLRQDYDQKYYDFFPYRYGAFSLVLARDKDYLTDLGYLKKRENFSVNRSRKISTLSTLATERSIDSLVKQVGNLRGDDLLRVIYKRFPYYASSSEKADSILSRSEYVKVRQHDRKETITCLFTLGYEKKSIDLYLDKLKENNIFMVIDVRNNPHSRKYGFSKRLLAKFVKFVGAEYTHLPKLGVPPQLRRELDDDEAYSNLFKYYEAKILSHQTKSLNMLKNILQQKKRVALTCFEADHRSCHRSILAKYLTKIENMILPVKHI